MIYDRQQNGTKTKQLKILALSGLSILLAIHLYGAYCYYFIAERKLSRFFILQTNIKAPND